MLRQNVIKFTLRIEVAVLLVTTVSGAPRQKKATDPPAVREIRAVLDSQVGAWNRRDLEGFMQGYWHSPDLTFYSGGTIVSARLAPR